MIDDIVQLFEEVMERPPKEYDTPAFPGTTLTKNNANEPHTKQEYMSLVGKLMYLTNKLAFEMSNAVQELACQMTNPSEEHWKHLE